MSFRQSGTSAEGIAAERRQTERLAAAGDPLAILQVEAWARGATVEPTSGMASVGALFARAVPAAAAVVGAFKRALPKLWAVESKRFDPKRSFDLKRWRGAFRHWADTICQPRPTLGLALVEELYRLAETGKGHAVETMERLGEVVRCSDETVRKFIRQAENAGFLDGWNRTARRTGGKLKNFVLREANVYVPLMPEDDLADARAAAPGSAEATLPNDQGVSIEQRWLGRISRQIKRGERYFVGLFGRSLGLNLTPLRPARSAPA